MSVRARSGVPRRICHGVLACRLPREGLVGDVPEWSAFDVGDVLEMLQERLRCLRDDVKHSHTRLPPESALSPPVVLTDKTRLTFMYSTKRFRNATKCSAFRMLPGIASLIISSDSTTPTHQPRADGQGEGEDVPGFAMISSSSRASLASCSPATSFAYSSCSLPASVRLILRRGSAPASFEGDKRRDVLFDLFGKLCHAPRGGIQHRPREVDRE
jgi:hypothetical protein